MGGRAGRVSHEKYSGLPAYRPADCELGQCACGDHDDQAGEGREQRQAVSSQAGLAEQVALAVGGNDNDKHADEADQQRVDQLKRDHGSAYMNQARIDRQGNASNCHSQSEVFGEKKQ